MYWWYLSFLILGLVSRGFRGLKLMEEGNEEEQVGLWGLAVYKDTHYPHFNYSGAGVSFQEWRVENCIENEKNIFFPQHLPHVKVKLLHAAYKCLTNLQMTACAGFDIQPCRLCVNVLTYRAKTELPQKCKLTVMNAEQLTAQHRVWQNRHVTILFGWRILQCFYTIASIYKQATSLIYSLKYSEQRKNLMKFKCGTKWKWNHYGF